MKNLYETLLLFFLLYKRVVSCQNEKQKEAVTKVLSQPLILNKRCSPANSSVTSHNIP
ncbi:hypothetical protein HMPREF1381_02520 [Enterococcus faecium R501]|nr:hypothetical protein HMPREF1381_02520 [Enterococcus faecium R501]